MNPDTIGCMRSLLRIYQDYSKSESISESAEDCENFVKATENIKNNICIPRDELPTYVPVLNPTEIEELDPEMDEKDKEWYDDYRKTFMIGANNDDYISKVRDACAEYDRRPCHETENNLLKIGWVPGVEPTAEVFAANKDRLYEYMLEHTVKMIDLSEVTNSLSESSDGVVAKAEGPLYPIYLVCVYTYSTMGKIITRVTSSKYSHAAIGFTPDLEKLYSFNLKNGDDANGGLAYESLSGYLKDNIAAKLYVQVIFATKSTYNKIRGNVDYYCSGYRSSKYSIGNLFNILAGRAKKTSYELSMVCSQFVDSILKLSNIDLTNKPSNLVTPNDIVQIKNPTVYKVYEGEAKDYKWPKIQRMVNKLSRNADSVRSTVYENAEKLYDDPTVLEIYKSIDSMLTAKATFTEANIPFEISDDGDISIATYKNYETSYQEIHTLLKTLEDTESIKIELCKLWCINCKIEGKLQKGRGKKKDLVPYYKLRSRVLNDFNKYMKKVYAAEKDFNFSEYYKNSEYYDGEIRVKKSTLKGIGKYVQDIVNFV
jgi:hypothetical protein